MNILKRLLAVSILLLLLCSHSAIAARIVNEAGGIACYSSQDLLIAHSAIGFFNFSQVQLLIAQDKCFKMHKHWQVKVLEEEVIGGANVKIVKIRLSISSESRWAWTLLKNLTSP